MNVIGCTPEYLNLLLRNAGERDLRNISIKLLQILKVTRPKLYEEAAKKVTLSFQDPACQITLRSRLSDYTPYVVARVNHCDIVLSYTTLIDYEHQQVV
ncbi:hypothetical protein P3L10_003408 [Capsicum annuum]